MLIVHASPAFVGRPGTFAQRGANFALQNADLVLAIGTSLSISCIGFNDQFAPKAEKILVNIDKGDLKPGDLVFFNTMRHAFSHVGVYLGDGKFIHSPRTGQQVRVEDMQASYWQRRFNGARRVALDGDAVARLSLAQSLSQ